MNGPPLAPGTVRNRLRYYARLAGLGNQRLYPRRLRATFVTRLNQRGVVVAVLQKFLGNADIKATCQYVGIAGRELRQAVEPLGPFRAAEWRRYSVNTR